jgi:hypothetical protein
MSFGNVTKIKMLNLFEPWFGEMTRKRIRYGVSRSLSNLMASIEAFIRVHNIKPKPFV